ncbi:MAG: O-antigen ligase family protein [Granulosicoccus sp.]|nr:O-antigen ligase family protein [Granulosicoccus sp.]
MPASYHAPYRAPILASVLLLLTLLQGSTFSLSIGFRGPLASDLLISLVTVGWLAMYLTAITGLFASFGINWITWLVRYRLPLTCLVAGAVFSTAWSMDSALTLERSIHLVGTSLIALYLGLSLPLHYILRVSANVLGLLMIASAMVAVGLPELGLKPYLDSYAWAGVLASKNTLGFWSAVSLLLVVSLCFWPVSTAQRLIYIVYAVFACICLYFSASATSVLALSTGALVMLYLHISINLRLGITATSLLGMLVAVIVLIMFQQINAAELIGRSGDLTGRGEVWEQTWKLILKRPLTGFGYGTIWFPTDQTVWIQQALTDFTWTVFHAHNGLLQIASEVGLPLTVITLIMIIQQLIEVIYCQYQRQQPGVLFVLGFMVALLLSNYSEARLLINRELYWIFFICLPVSMLQQVTVAGGQSVNIRTRFNRPIRPRSTLRIAREKVAQKRALKQRLVKRDSARMINTHPESNPSRLIKLGREHNSGTSIHSKPANQPLISQDKSKINVHLHDAIQHQQNEQDTAQKIPKPLSLKQRIAQWRKKAG